MLVTGLVTGALLSTIIAVWVSRHSVEVRERECVLVARGRTVVAVLDTPGLHWLPFSQALGARLHRVSLRHQTGVGAAAWSSRVVQVWLDFQVVRPCESFERVVDLPAELNSTVLDHARRLLTETPGLDAPERRDELNASVLAAAQPRAQWLGAQLSSVLVNLAKTPRLSTPPAPIFDLTGLPPLPRVTGWRS